MFVLSCDEVNDGCDVGLCNQLLERRELLLALSLASQALLELWNDASPPA